MNATAQVYACENCAIRRKAEARPTSLLARIWRWHTKYCPGWKAYQKHLASAGEKADNINK